ncbi:MAG: hypothetical protein J6Y00_07200 [Paludibacteraceae bacterium]|nr:hypothetical protein [Paludibacteraceae bacterium]
MDDLKKLVNWSIRRWYVYAACLAASIVLGYVIYRFTPSSYKVSASLMLRNRSQQQNTQDQLIGMMGFGDEKTTVDEVEVLRSSSLMEQVVDRLNLRTLYYQRTGFQWKNLYPELPFTLTFPAECPNLLATLIADADGYTLRIKDENGKKSEAHIADMRQPFKTHLGDMLIVADGKMEDGKYRIVHRTTEWAVQDFRERISVSRNSRESRIIHLSATTSEEQLIRDVISAMLSIYHHESASDKNVLARETEIFLKDRIAEVAAELDSTEAELEAYKRAYRIANLDIAAESYRTNSELYEQRVAQLDADLAVLDFMAQRLNAMGDDFTVLPSNLGISDGAISELVRLYNSLVLDCEKLRQTALPGNPKLDSKTEQAGHTRRELLSAIEQSRQSTLLTRENIRKQRDVYANRLQATPEQERRYQEMLRNRNAKEKQYNFLVESREENSLLLASDAMPVKIIERPTICPKRVSPKMSRILLMSILLGLILPVVWFFLMEIMAVLRATPAGLSASPVSSKEDNE